MKKRGFTLVELLGVIIIVAVLSLLVFPLFMNQFRKNKEQISDIMKTTLETAASAYIDENPNMYEKTNGNVYCITLNQLVNSNNLSSPVMDPTTGEEFPLSNIIKVSVENLQYIYSYVGNGSCTEARH